ncbi:hypothetical protein H2199_009144 [Coniosporium tulheliwenetii]|uniref:Uncharacterized protein n=1 Tax=Coniosporium tulheliwenetii TaxID=3383036 RepID=A0ACC2YFH2_9PEZI|nr:hypothetical protein H2199_009144 [Cladosporium sp. JES 115]
MVPNLPPWLRWYKKPSVIPGSPLSFYDFYMYLRHIEFSQENLEFYVWFKDYEARYRKDSHPFPRNEASPLLLTEKSDAKSGCSSLAVSEVQSEQELIYDEQADFVHYVESLVLSRDCKFPKTCRNFCTYSFQGSDNAPVTSTIASCHHELQHIVALFLVPGSPKELNLPDSMRKAAIASIATSDCPANLAPIAEHIYDLLHSCSHRNFIRLGVKNGTFETLCMVTIMGIVLTSLGLLVMLLVAFASPSIHRSSRWRGLAAAPFWVLGFSFFFAGTRGSCFLLLLFTRRQELPWERVEEYQSIRSAGSGNTFVRFMKRLMIFERKIRVEDVGLRNLQHKIVVQSVAGAFAVTVLLLTFFLCLPIWN